MYAIRSYYEPVAERSAAPPSALTLAGPERRTRPLAEDVGEVLDAVVTVRSGGGHGSGFFISHDGYRITSYNVCYTKLLRITRKLTPIAAQATATHCRRVIVSRRKTKPNTRITSYNVCYTKLLRSPSPSR